MPTFHKLPQDAVLVKQTKPRGIRAQVAAEYDAYLNDFVAGEVGEIQLDAADSPHTVRNRLTAAAARRGLVLTTFTYIRGRRYTFAIDEAPQEVQPETCS